MKEIEVLEILKIQQGHISSRFVFHPFHAVMLPSPVVHSTGRVPPS